MKHSKILTAMLALLLAVLVTGAALPFFAEGEDGTSSEGSSETSDAASSDTTSEGTSDTTSEGSSDTTSEGTSSGESSESGTSESSETSEGASSDAASDLPPETETVEGIEVIMPPSKTKYTVGDQLKLSGLRVYVYIVEKAEPKILKDGDGVTVSPTTLNKAGEQTVTVSAEGFSDSFTVNVEAITPDKPVILSNPADATAAVGNVLTLQVKASCEVGELRYQWYRAATPDSHDMTVLTNANAAQYIPAQEEGTAYYCCGVRGYLNGESGEQVLSGFAKVTYTPRVSLVEITEQPKALTLHDGGADGTFTVKAENAVRFAWYMSAAAGAERTKLIEGQAGCTGVNGDTLTVPAQMILNGSLFCCEVFDDSGKSVFTEAAVLTVMRAEDEGESSGSATSGDVPVTPVNPVEPLPGEKKSSFRWWMVVLPLLVVASGTGVAMIIIRKKADEYEDDEDV